MEKELENKVEDTTTQTGSTEEQKPEGSKDEADVSKQTDSEIDYKAELESERKRREKAENAAIKYKKRVKEAHEEQDIDKIVEERVQSILDNKLSEFEQRTIEDNLEDSISRVSTNEDEAELIKYHLENSIKMNGSSKADIESAVRRAKLLANEKKILRSQSELSEALKTQHTLETTRNVAGQKEQRGSERPLTNAEKRIISGLRTSKERYINR